MRRLCRHRRRAGRELPAGHARARSAWRRTTCIARNPGLVITRVTGFGQDGPYARRPGFATLAEAMSGFAAINGEPDGAPLLPPIALTDEVDGAGRRVRHDGRRALRRRPGRRRQPARVAVPADGPAALGLSLCSATSSRGSARASPTRCPRGTYRTRRRPVGGHLARRPSRSPGGCIDADRCRRRRAVRHLRRAGATTARRSTRGLADWVAARDLRRGARRVRGGPRRRGSGL